MGLARALRQRRRRPARDLHRLDQTPGGFIDWAGGEMRALDWSNGSVRELWKRRVDDVIHSSPAIGDIDGDGRVEAVVGGGDVYHHGDGKRVFAWHVDDGSTVAGWPVTTGGVTNSSPALGDVTGDGVPEVAIGSGDGILRVIRGNGQMYWTRQLRFINSPGHAILASPIIADMNGDGRNDVGVGNDWGYFVVDGPTGNEMYSVNEFYSLEAAAAVGDFGNLGWRLIVSAFDTPNNNTRIQAYQIPGPGIFPPWPMFHRTATHVGAPPSGGTPSHPVCAAGPRIRRTRRRRARRRAGTGCSATTAGSSRSAGHRSSAVWPSPQRRERGRHADVAEWQRLLHPHEPR
jgi:hypothetical protein